VTTTSLTITWDALDPELFQVVLLLPPPVEPCNDVVLGVRPEAKLEVVESKWLVQGSAGKTAVIDSRVEPGVLNDLRLAKLPLALNVCGLSIAIGSETQGAVRSFMRRVTAARARAGMAPMDLERRPVNTPAPIESEERDDAAIDEDTEKAPTEPSSETGLDAEP
jgi:hypothetical protein